MCLPTCVYVELPYSKINRYDTTISYISRMILFVIYFLPQKIKTFHVNFNWRYFFHVNCSSFCTMEGDIELLLEPCEEDARRPRWYSIVMMDLACCNGYACFCPCALCLCALLWQDTAGFNKIAGFRGVVSEFLMLYEKWKPPRYNYSSEI